MLNTILAQNPLSNPWQSPPLNVGEKMMFKMIPKMIAGYQGNDIREVAGPCMVLIRVTAIRFAVRQICAEIKQLQSTSERWYYPEQHKVQPLKTKQENQYVEDNSHSDNLIRT